jgi:predicted MFS family arabinose efflux permease
MSEPVSERRLILLVGAVQFVNILDFMMVMPLGPDFAQGLGISASRLGYVGGAYTAAAGISGLVAALFLDRVGRRRALTLAMLGLLVGTAAGGLAVDFTTLLASRVVAGAFGGPATSVALAIIADAIPAERRGKALGAVMGAFSVATVLGVPAGLKLAELGGWRTPFFAVAALALGITALAASLLPPLNAHMARGEKAARAGLRELVRPAVLLSWTMTASLNLAVFTVVPNLSAYLQYNLRFPRAALGSLYLGGGVASFFAMMLVGRAVDRFGARRVGLFGTLWFMMVLWLGFVRPLPGLPVAAMFVGFMLSNSLRNVPHSTLTSRVPSSRERARFQSIQSAVQHFSSALGAFAAAHFLRELPTGALEGMPAVATFALVLAAAFPVLAWAVETRLGAAVAEPAPERA